MIHRDIAGEVWVAEICMMNLFIFQDVTLIINQA
jgi:hypothetical protein